MTGRPRLVIALVVASLLAVFLVYQGFVSAGTLLVSVSQLRSDRDGAAHKKVTLTGVVVQTSGTTSPMRFVLKDDGAPVTVPVSYHGSVPDAFKATRHDHRDRAATRRRVRRGAGYAAHEVPQQVLLRRLRHLMRRAAP